MSMRKGLALYSLESWSRRHRTGTGSTIDYKESLPCRRRFCAISNDVVNM